MATKKVEILIRVQPELKERVKEYADSNSWSLSIVGEKALDAYLQLDYIAKMEKTTPEEMIFKLHEITPYLSQNPEHIDFKKVLEEMHEKYKSALKKFDEVSESQEKMFSEYMDSYKENEEKFIKYIDLLESDPELSEIIKKRFSSEKSKD